MTEDEVLLAYKDGRYSEAEASYFLRRLRACAAKRDLSEGQKGLWFLEKGSPDGAAYNVPLCFSWPIHFDQETFTRACEVVVRRHPVLNSAIVEERGVPYRRIRCSESVDYDHEDVPGMSESQLIEHLRGRWKVPFELANGPLIRFSTFSNGMKNYVLIVVHHVVFDGASAGILLRDLMEAYCAALEDRGRDVSPGPVGYSDFVDWERKFLASAEATRCLSYWKQKLHDIPSNLTLALERRTSKSPATALSKTQTLRLSSRVSHGIKNLCQANGFTPAALFLGLYQLLLQRSSNERDIVVGMATMGRPLSAFDDLIGYFVNMIPIRSAVRDEQPLVEFLNELKTAVYDGIENSVYPFPLLVREIAPTHQRGVSPIFQVGFVYQSGSLFRSKSTTVSVILEQLEMLNGVNQEGEFKIVLEISEAERAFDIKVKYHKDRFDDADVESLIAQYSRLAESVVDDPTRALGDYSHLSRRQREEEQEVRRLANLTEAERFGDRLHGRFVEKAIESPERIALEYEGGRMTYGELLGRSSALAQRLIERGARRNELIGVVLDKGWEQVVAVLGILLSGAAYLPIDPRWPVQRRVQLLEQGEARMVVTRKEVGEASEWPVGCERIGVSREDAVARVEEIPAARQGIDDLAYVIFTSGSTGTPKGVVIDHKSAVNTVLHINRLFEVGQNDKVLAVSELSFDLSVYDIFGVLAAGGTVVIPEPALARDPNHWLELIRRHGVTIWNSVPQLMSMLVEVVELERTGRGISPLRLVLMSGDWIPVRLPGRIKAQSPLTKVISLGGATEGSVWSIYYPIEKVDPSWESIPYGKALPNQHMYVLNKQLQPCPEGVAGDIYIGGTGVALGYWKNEMQTQAQFMEHPQSGERLYKTGDLGRFKVDGNIEFLGRNDKQVKIRGFRIELGEIESQLNRHPAVKEAVVIVREDAPGEKRLAAYFTANGEAPPVEQLRSHLKDALPDYMVPNAFVLLDALPLTPNGKLDRNALPVPELAAFGVRDYEAPRGDTEAILATIWRELLNVERVGRHDNFFELGGHSLLVMQMNERLHDAGWHADVSSWFSAASLADLASVVRVHGDTMAVPENRIPTHQRGDTENHLVVLKI